MMKPQLADFTRIYREWIIRRRGTSDAVELRSEQWRLMLYCMASAATLGEAVQLLLRFKKLVWDRRVATELHDAGSGIALVSTCHWNRTQSVLVTPPDYPYRTSTFAARSGCCAVANACSTSRAAKR